MHMIKTPVHMFEADQMVEFLAVLLCEYGNVNPDGHKQLMMTQAMHDKLADKFRVLVETDEDSDISPITFILEEATD